MGQICVYNAVSCPKNIIVYGQIGVKKGVSGPKSRHNFGRCEKSRNIRHGSKLGNKYLNKKISANRELSRVVTISKMETVQMEAGDLQLSSYHKWLFD